LASMPEEVRQLCRLADIQSKSILLQIVRQGDPEKMAALVQRLGRDGVTRVEARRVARKQEARRGRPKHFVFRFKPKGSDFSFNLQFKRSQVEREDIIRTLEGILDSLRKNG
jgi:ParB family chromosome partitioning protein